MHAKLTLRLGESLIEQAKKYGKKSGKSLSQIVSDYFLLLADRFKRGDKDIPLTPLVASLKGRLRGAKLGIKEYRRHLETKYL